MDVSSSVSKSGSKSLSCLQSLPYASRLKKWALGRGVCIYTYLGGTPSISDWLAASLLVGGTSGLSSRCGVGSGVALGEVHPSLCVSSVSGSVSNGSGWPGFGPGQEPQSNRTGQVLAGCYPDRTYTRRFLAGLEPEQGSIFTVPATMALIEYLSSHCIKTWSVRRLCISSCSFTSHCQICDQVNFRWVAVKKKPIFSENHGFSKRTQRIVVRF